MIRHVYIIQVRTFSLHIILDINYVMCLNLIEYRSLLVWNLSKLIHEV